jgi:hypothetical protein
MFVLNVLLAVAMLFFLFLPITDRKTVEMKAAMLCMLAALFAASVSWGHMPPVQFASVVSMR